MKTFLMKLKRAIIEHDVCIYITQPGGLLRIKCCLLSADGYWANDCRTAPETSSRSPLAAAHMSGG